MFAAGRVAPALREHILASKLFALGLAMVFVGVVVFVVVIVISVVVVWSDEKCVICFSFSVVSITLLVTVNDAVILVNITLLLSPLSLSPATMLAQCIEPLARRHLVIFTKLLQRVSVVVAISTAVITVTISTARSIVNNPGRRVFFGRQARAGSASAPFFVIVVVVVVVVVALLLRSSSSSSPWRPVSFRRAGLLGDAELHQPSGSQYRAQTPNTTSRLSNTTS